MCANECKTESGYIQDCWYVINKLSLIWPILLYNGFALLFRIKGCTSQGAYKIMRNNGVIYM